MAKDELLVQSEFFSGESGCDLYFKPEWNGPTRAHKDRWATVAIRLAKQAGATKVVVLTSGNQGLALAVEAIKNGVECFISTEAAIDPIYLDLFKKYSAVVYLAEDEKTQYEKYEEIIGQGYYPIGVTHEERAEGRQMPAIDAYKVTAKEIVESLGGSPDIIVFPTAYADHPMGVLRGFEDMFDSKKIDAMPKFILARANLAEGGNAKSIATNRTTPYIKDVIKRSNGKDYFVNDDEMRKAQDDIFKKHGWKVELSSAASLAVLEKIPKNQLKNKKVVVMLTALEDKTGI